MPRNEPAAVLLTWVAVNNDPYERDRNSGDFRRVDGKLIPGPTLTLLCDARSPFKGAIGDVVFFHRDAPDGSREDRALRETVAAIREQSPETKIRDCAWKGDDPTDHQGIYQFLRKELPLLRQRYEGRRLVVHLSPGTPAMHTVWVLMVETGMVAPPVEIVKSYRPDENKGLPSVVPVKLGLDTFFKVYQRQHGRRSLVETEDQVFWDPRKFKSQKLKNLFAEARRFARLNVPLMILGERGTGKTTLASWIRANSDFRKPSNDTNWPSVPCGQYSAETMRAELFGYKQGAFTGATEDKEGLLARADGDTLFLDEIGDVSSPLQRLLIRAVEEHIYSPLGSTELCTSRFRLISATNRDLSTLRQRLDPDFLDRISMLRIEMPPLREIGEEIPWLWEQALAEAAKRSCCSVDASRLNQASREVLPQLRREALPGNMRDLFVVAYRMIAALGDEADSMSASVAAEYALDGLSQHLGDGDAVSQGIMRCFADRTAIDPWIESLGKLDTKALLAEVRRYLASEVRRYAAARGVRPEEVCDVAERTLRQWVEGAA